MPIVRDTPMLNAMREQRVQYYRNLVKDAAYLEVIVAIHSVLRKLHAHIDQLKLPELAVNLFTRTTRNQNKELEHHPTTYTELHRLLAKDKPWYQLGSVSRSDEYYGDDSHFCPWRAILNQYHVVESFLRDAASHDALDGETEQLQEELQSLLTRLHQRLEEPWYRMHIGAFECIEELVPEVSRQPGQEEDGRLRAIVRKHFRAYPQVRDVEYKEIQRSAEIVCDDLLLVLQEAEVPSKRKKTGGRQKGVKWLGNGKLVHDGEEYFLPKERQFSTLCDELYVHCRLVGGFVRTKVIFEKVKKDRYEADPVGNWKWLYDTVSTINKWAKRRHLPPLFKCSWKRVERVA